MHPSGSPTDAEFEEYVSYAIECRRRVKEQMNKRKPDDEFARINLSFLRANGEEVFVFCPESKEAAATQQPVRKNIDGSEVKSASRAAAPAASASAAKPVEEKPVGSIFEEAMRPELKEQHYTILYGDSGHSYESILGPYLAGAKLVTIEDPYIRMPHQIQNFVRFCETLVIASAVKKIKLITGYDDASQMADTKEKLEDLGQSLLEMDIELEIKMNPNLHDREIRLDNGWVIKIGRGIDFYQKPGSWFEVGANDLSLRKCLETKVDIYLDK